MAALSPPPATRDGFQIAVICALPEERDAVEAAMTRDYKDEGHTYGRAPGDDNYYTTGELGRKPVVLATPRNMGTINTSHLVTHMRHSFPNLALALVVGIAGGAPFRYDNQKGTWIDSDIHLGDVIVSTQVIGYDFGAEHENSFKQKTAVEDILPRAPTLITTFLNVSKTGKSKAFKRVLGKTNADLEGWGNEYKRPTPETDCVYSSAYRHKHRQGVCEICNRCAEWHHDVCGEALGANCRELGCVRKHTNEARDTKIHFGRVASGNAVLKSARRRDTLIQEEDCIAFEMEGAGTWDVVGTIVVKGVVEYADSHKNKTWRLYPAARAALCAKALIEEIELIDLPQERHTGTEQSQPAIFNITGARVSNVNSGLGVQKNYNQSGGSNNIQNNAHIIHNHPPQAKIETPPLPVFTVPFHRDPNFVDRPELNLLQERLSCNLGRVALFGIGGVGKSQLVIEYCYRLQEQSPDTWVLWLHASNTARYGMAIREVADQLRIAGRDDPKANIFQLFQHWLCDRRKRKWLLVLDNADEASYLFKPPDERVDSVSNSKVNAGAKRLVDYLPICSHGSIVITTRNLRIASRLADDANIVKLQPMDAGCALDLLEKKIEPQSDWTSAKELVKALEHMPLAIAQAAAYIKQRTPRMSVSEYLEKFKKSEKSQIRLLGADPGDPLDVVSEELQRDREAASSILLTWQISFEHIRQTRSSAADLLSLMSFFDHQGIPESVLRFRDVFGLGTELVTKQTRTDEDNDLQSASETSADEDSDEGSIHDDRTESGSESSVDEDFEKDIVTLRNYSFISDTPSRTTFEMHRLVQLATRKWLKSYKKHTYWLEQSLWNLDAALPDGDYKNWAEWRALYPHAKLAFDLKPKTRDAALKWASISNKAACFMSHQGSAADAERFAKGSANLRTDLLGEEHPDTLISIINLALTYWSQGRWKEAEELQVSGMERRKRVLGEEHPDTLMSISNLASTYQNQGRWKEAEELEVSVIKTKKRVLGEEHPDTLTSISNLASTYWNQGRLKEVEELQVSVMETRKRVLGEEHPDTLTSIANLTSTYQNQGRWKEAEGLQVSLMETRKRVLGEEHPDTLRSTANLASIYWNQGRWKEAEELQVLLMETRKQVLGEEHPDTLKSIANLASTYQNKGRWKEAEELQVSVMETTKRVLGEEHPDTLTNMNNLTMTYWNQGRLKEAEELEVSVIKMRKRVLGEEHPDTLTSLAKLASTYWNQGQFKEAEELEVQVMETRKRVLGEEHPDTLRSIANLAYTFKSQRRIVTASVLFNKAINLALRVHGPKHPDISSWAAAIDDM